jgi:hypothetical protein
MRSGSFISVCAPSSVSVESRTKVAIPGGALLAVDQRV